MNKFIVILILLCLISGVFAVTGTAGTISSDFTIVTSFEQISASSGDINSTFAMTDITTGVGSAGTFESELGLFYRTFAAPVIDPIIPNNACELISLFPIILIGAFLVLTILAFVKIKYGDLKTAFISAGGAAILLVILMIFYATLYQTMCVI